MTSSEARRIIDSYYSKNVHSEDEDFLFVEALEYLVVTEDDPRAMMDLGGHYYALRKYDLALKYYEMASNLDYDDADECLGYVWYYGRTGTKDYDKAFYYFGRAADRGNIVARYKLADMYKNGYGVAEDYEKYKQIIRELYPKVKNARNLGDPLPEIFTRLAHIEAEEGNEDEAVDLYLAAKDFLAQRIRYNPFFGNLNIMKWLIEDLYKLIVPYPENIFFYDLYYFLTKPCEVNFTYRGKEYTVRAVEENGEVVIEFDSKWFRNVDDFMKKAKIGNKLLTDIYDKLGTITVTEG